MSELVEFDPLTGLPQRLEHFTILALLGQGWMGIVFKARDEKFDSEVALKMIKPELASSQASRERFLREARAAASLRDHDHIVAVYWVNEIRLNDGRFLLYLTMPVLLGETLETRICRENGRPLPLSEQLRIGKQISNGLFAAHQKGLIHRDIKPGNIWLEKRSDDYDRVKILDFGLARTGSDSHLTSTGAAMGTPAFMAPEQSGSGDLDYRADLWSLGVVLYQMATGRLPFEGTNPYELILNVRMNELPSPGKMNPALSKPHVALIESLLSKNREQRPESARTVVQELNAIDRSMTLEPTSSNIHFPPSIADTAPMFSSNDVVMLPPNGKSPTPKRSWKMKIGLFLATALLCGALIAWASWSIANRSSSTEVVENTNEKVSPTNDETITSATKVEPIPTKQEPIPTKQEPPKVDPNAPPLLTGDLRTPEFEQLRQAWATYYGKIPLDYTEDLGNGVKLHMEFVAPGKYFMGLSVSELKTILANDDSVTEADFASELPQHEVTVTKGFYIGKYEITQQQYFQVRDQNPSGYSPKGSKGSRVAGIDSHLFPVESVSWEDTQGFIAILNNLPTVKTSKRKYRLPHEAEWELAARAGAYGKDSKPFHFTQAQSTLFSTEANFDGRHQYGKKEMGTYIERPEEVTKRNKPNRYFIHGLHANVWEWCEDWYDANYYKMSTSVDPTGPKEGTTRVIRGGCYSSSATGCRTATRSEENPNGTRITLGFRVVAEVPPKSN